ncbi:uncharacterized protein ATC70_001968 [Mucor velutinosus]|uniref:Uncharacterized protein n=1 Tax=Mucor velutinosus TaxID=708070 RepID=A0AAN7DEH2_9FUNG|nr:hypothetical protein ATC70_001968 [Mucor velutinosus]
MPSITEKKSKKSGNSSSSSSSKKAKKALAQQNLQDLGEPVVPTKSKKSKKTKTPVIDQEEPEEQLNDVTDEITEEINNAAQDVSDGVKDIAQEAQAEIDDDSDEDEGPFAGNTDAMTLMNAISEYNRMLMQRLSSLESEAKEQGEEVSKQSVKDTVQGTYNDIKTKYDKKSDSKGTHHSFELPIGDMMKGYGNFDTTPLEDDDQDNQDSEEHQKQEKKDKDEESTVHDGEENSGKLSIGNGDKDDIVVKVEATKTGITFCIHIPRN